MNTQELVKQASSELQRGDIGFPEAMLLFGAAYINVALQGANGNKCKAAKKLGIHRNTLMRHLLDLQARGIPVERRVEQRPVKRERHRRRLVDYERWQLQRSGIA